MLAWPWQIAGVLGKKEVVRSNLLREQNQAYTEKPSTKSNLEEGALQACACATLNTFSFKWTLHTLPNCSKSWHSCSFLIGLYGWDFVLTCCSVEKNVFPWHGCWLQLFDVCHKFIPTFTHTCLWCCQLSSSGVPYTRLVFKMFLHLTSQHWWNVLEMGSTLPTVCQISLWNLWCLRQVEEVWVSDSNMIRFRFLLTREETPPIEISQTFCWIRPNQQRRRQEHNL